ncbi:MAG: hypothetical protein ACE5FT_04230 [Candidatus Nanoarchaeia archaeon]
MGMEDIERLKKISQMSKELQKHGIATNSEEGFKQSEAIYQASTPNMEVNKDLTSSHVEQPSAEAATAQQVNTGALSDFQRFQNTVNDRLGKLESGLTNVIGKLNEMIKEINRLEGRLEQGGVPELPKERQETIAPKEEPKKEAESQSRSGEYTPGDVAIDKIFYYGNK